MSAKTMTPKRERGRKTLAKLLDATAGVLEKHGLDGCTMPRISAAAGISPAAVYRHFADKNALLEAVFRRTQSEGPPAAKLTAPTLEATAAKIVAALLAESHGNSRTQGALTQFLSAAPSTSPSAAFVRAAQDARKARLQSMADAVLAHRDRIRHPDPQRAAMFAVLAAAASADNAQRFSTALPLSPKQFAAELERAFVAYLRKKKDKE